MRNRKYAALAIAILLFYAPFGARAEETEKTNIRIVCVGDSITFGATTQDPLHESYPARMKKIEGPLKLKIYNCGESGTMVRRESTRAYTLTRAYASSLEKEPDVVLLMMGSNDANAWRPQNFEADFRALIADYQTLPSKPVVFVLFPPYRFNSEEALAILKDELIPMEKKVAEEMGCPTIDMFSFSATLSDVFPDGLHPNAEGYQRFADYLYDQLCAYFLPEEEP